MYWAMASLAAWVLRPSASRHNAARKTVLGISRPRTEREMPLASMASSWGSSMARVLFTSARPPGLSSPRHSGPKRVSSR